MSSVIDHKARGHARFGASSAARWFACPGSVRLCDMVEKRAAGAAADEGTRAHELLEAVLRSSQFERKAGREVSRVLIDPAARQGDAEVSGEMRDAVQVAVDYVTEILADNPDAVMLVEHPFEIPVAAAPGEVWGTCDVVIFVPSLRLLYVIDYKHGAGVFVDVRGNKQLRFYGLGALSSTPRLQLTCEVGTVALVIIQPRCSVGQPIREEWLAVEDLLEFGKEIGAAVEAAKAEGAPLVPGEEQCRFCPAKVVCPARERQALDAAGADFGHVAKVGAVAVPAAPELTNERIGEVLVAAPLIKAWLDSVAEEGFARMMAGGAVPGQKLVEVQARRQWENEETAAMQLADLTGLPSSHFVVEKIKPLGEIEKLIKQYAPQRAAGMMEPREAIRTALDAMAFLTTKKSSGKLTIAPASDPRPAASKVADAFAGVQQVEVQS